MITIEKVEETTIDLQELIQNFMNFSRTVYEAINLEHSNAYTEAFMLLALENILEEKRKNGE